MQGEGALSTQKRGGQGREERRKQGVSREKEEEFAGN
jgi:hypothetical protein